MAGGKGAAKRANTRRTRAKRKRQKAAQEVDQAHTELSIPTVTEDDLLAFQLSHFADDTKPEVWFVTAETALNYNPAFEEEDEDYDGLGYYEDGVKRTLTDEQIEMFRHSEMEMMLREERLRNEQNNPSPEETETAVVGENQRPASEVSDISSMEDDLLALAQSHPPAQSKRRAQSQSTRSEASTDPRRRSRKEEVPYYERHKRKWEAYIEENDPVEGSLTHRRIVREMDELHDTCVELDY